MAFEWPQQRRDRRDHLRTRLIKECFSLVSDAWGAMDEGEDDIFRVQLLRVRGLVDALLALNPEALDHEETPRV